MTTLTFLQKKNSRIGAISWLSDAKVRGRAIRQATSKEKADAESKFRGELPARESKPEASNIGLAGSLSKQLLAE